MKKKMGALGQINVIRVLVLFVFNTFLVLVVTGQPRATSKNMCQTSDDLRMEVVKLISTGDEDLKKELSRIAQATSQCLEPVTFESPYWTLAFHGQAGVGKSVLDAYLTGAGIPANVDQGCIEYTSGRPCTSHYRNDTILDNWKDIKKVLFMVFSGRTAVKQILFSAEGSNNLNWFRSENVKSSTWLGLDKNITDTFSIEGESSISGKRTFFISHVNKKCHNSDGWFVALDASFDQCVFGELKFPVLLYSSKEEYSFWNSKDVKAADAFELYIAYD